MTSVAPTLFDHLAALTDELGTFEHAEYAVPRREHGYCVDDVARVLVVTSREQHPTSQVRALAVGSLAFIRASQGVRGGCRNRRSVDGRWTSPVTTGDCWGRSLWGLGEATASGQTWIDDEALHLFERGATARSRWPRAMGFAALGAAAVLQVDPSNTSAISLLRDVAGAIDVVDNDTLWPWPEPRLTYANALVPEAMIATGAALERTDLVEKGLELLRWLISMETNGDHLSVTPVGGSAPGDLSPRFDQQPIEVATLADACARAFAVDGSTEWLSTLRIANSWFDGNNDGNVVMWDETTGGGYDGLMESSANLNEGAESTLALVATRQHALRHLTVAS